VEYSSIDLHPKAGSEKKLKASPTIKQSNNFPEQLNGNSRQGHFSVCQWGDGPYNRFKKTSNHVANMIKELELLPPGILYACCILSSKTRLTLLSANEPMGRKVIESRSFFGAGR
jgi:hypothetical protein